MAEKKNYHVYKGHTLEDYNKKYSNKNYKVVAKVDADKDPKLLENKSWWLIEDKYYEVPNSKCPPVRWWKNLNTTGRVITCILGAGVIATAVAVPVAVTMNQSHLVDVSVTTSDAKAERRMDGDNLVITLTCVDSDNEVKSVEKVTVGNTDLTPDQYTFDKDSQTIIIKKEVLDKNPGSVTITPKVGKKVDPVVQHTVTYMVGEAVYITQKVDHGSATQEPEPPSKPGYLFMDWQYNGQGFDFNTPITKDITLIARFEVVSFEITYHNVTEEEHTNPLTYTIEDETIKLEAAHRDGYKFLGWYCDETFETPITEIPQGSVGNKDIYAKFEVVEYTITYENVTEGEHKNPAKYTIESETITLQDAQREGYEFKGWYSDDSFATKVTEIAKGSTGDRTLYAKFEAIEYTITYHNVKEDEHENPAKYTIESETITLGDARRVAYDFIGWYSDEALETPITEIPQGTIGNIDIYAKFNAIEYTITYVNVTEGEHKNPAKYTIESETITLQDAQRQGYEFIGWYNDPGFVTPVTEITKGSTGNRTVYAKFEAIEYTITYHNVAEGEHKNPATYTIEDETIKLSDAQRDNYKFAGWYSDETSTTPITEIPQGSIGNKDIYAKWDEIKVTSITIDASKTEITVGDKLQFSKVVSPQDATNPNVDWKLNFPLLNRELATIDENGLLTATGAGEVQVYAVAKDGSEVVSNTFNLEIKAKEVLVESVSITTSETEVTVGERIELTASVLPEDATNKELKWEIDQSTATGKAEIIEEGGKVYLEGGATIGKVNVTATAQDGSGKSDNKDFDVKEPTPYHIDWATTRHPEFGQTKSGFDKTLYDLAETANGIIFGKTSKYKDKVKELTAVAVGETDEDKIDAYYDSTTGMIYVLSTGKIVLEDNDSPVGGGGFFVFCNKLTSAIFENIDTSKITNMTYMFYGVSQVETLDLSNFDTSNVTNMENMFDLGETENNYLQYLNVSSFDTSKVTSMSEMFKGCEYLTELDVSSFDTSKVTNMSDMFFNCSSLLSLDLTSFNTSLVTNMSRMFYNCISITSLDVSSFDTSKVENVSYMFACTGKEGNEMALETIFASYDFDVAHITEPDNFSNVFYGCKHLVGGMGTMWSSEHTDGTYARIDQGSTSTLPGYFTDVKKPGIHPSCGSRLEIPIGNVHGFLIKDEFENDVSAATKFDQDLPTELDIFYDSDVFQSFVISALNAEVGQTGTVKFTYENEEKVEYTCTLTVVVVDKIANLDSTDLTEQLKTEKGIDLISCTSITSYTEGGDIKLTYQYSGEDVKATLYLFDESGWLVQSFDVTFEHCEALEEKTISLKLTQWDSLSHQNNLKFTLNASE